MNTTLETTLKHLATKLKALRQEKGISQAELAWNSGISNTFLAEIETETKQPSLQSLIKLANALDVYPGDLLPTSTSSMEEILAYRSEIKELLISLSEEIKKGV